MSYTSFLITLANAGQCVIAVAIITPCAPFPATKEIKIIKTKCGIPINISTVHRTILSTVLLPIAALIPSVSAIITPITEPMIPTNKENLNPLTVLTSISRPMLSVPNK